MKELIRMILEERYMWASAEVDRMIDDLVDEYRTAFDDVEELQSDISNGMYGKVIQNRYDSLMRWREYIRQKEEIKWNRNSK